MCELSCRNTTGASPELPWPRALQPPWPVAEGVCDPPRVAPGTGRGNIGLFGGETSCSPPVSSHHSSRALPTQEPHKRDRVSCFLKNIYKYVPLCSAIFSSGSRFHPRWLLGREGPPASTRPWHGGTETSPGSCLCLGWCPESSILQPSRGLAGGGWQPDGCFKARQAA